MREGGGAAPAAEELSSRPLRSDAFWLRHMATACLLGLVASAGVLAYYLATPSGPQRPLLVALTLVAVGVSVAGMWLRRLMHTEARRSLVLKVFLLAMLVLTSVGAVLDGGHGSPVVDYLVAPVLFAALTCPARQVAAFGAFALLVNVSVAALGTRQEPTPVVATQLGATFLLCAIAVTAAYGRHLHEEKIADLLRRLARQARLDQLTGLPNRLAFSERLDKEVQRSRATGRRFALLVLDLDGFKRVNDERGHEAGDHLLQSVADALRRAVRGGDFAARLGGDEFALLLPLADGAKEMVERVRTEVAAADEQGVVSVSVGVSTFGNPADTPEGLIRRADARMYEDKWAHQGAPRIAG